MKIEFVCDLAGNPSPLRHFWKYCVGSDHAPVALRADWQQQLARCHDELGFERVRFHPLLSDDVGTLVRESNAVRLSLGLPSGLTLHRNWHPFEHLALSPDGETLAFAATDPSGQSSLRQ